jgi:ligand-binding sensor domain-containing protein/signal transduction histidine kinase
VPRRDVKAAILGWLLCAALPTYHADAVPQYFLHQWQKQNGLPDNAVSAIVQSHEGYLWLGTYSGLVRFDGARFVLFDNNNTPEMQSSRVTSLYEDREGNLWIGHETGEVTRYSRGRFSAVASTREGKRRKISAIGQDEDGEVWLMTEEGLMTRVRDDLSLIPPAGNAPGQLAFTIDRARHIWLARQGRLSRLEHGKLLPVEFPGETAEPYVQGVCASADGGVWIASDGKLRKWRNGNWTRDLGNAPWGLSGLSRFMETQGGTIVGGTVDTGLFLITRRNELLQFNSTNGFPQNWMRTNDLLQFNRTNGLPQNWIRSLCEDREGNLWVGAGSAGMVALREGKVATINPPDHWDGRTVTSLSGTDGKDMWISTEGAGLYHLKDGAWEHFGESNGLANSYVWSVTKDRRNRIWAGTWGGGVFVQTESAGDKAGGKTGIQFALAPGLENLRAAAPAILQGANGVTWIGTDEGLIRYEDGKIARYGEAEGLDWPEVRTLAEAPDGTLWFGMFGGGLGRLREGTLKQFRTRDGLPSDFIQCLKLDADGSMWLGTSGNGLIRMKDGRFVRMTQQHGLANNVICHIEEDGEGYFWISSHGGIMRIAKADLNACADGKTNQFNCLTYGEGEGMQTLDCSGGMQPAGCRTDDGRLWFPTSKGLVVVNPKTKDIKKNSLPPPVIVEDLLVDGKSQFTRDKSNLNATESAYVEIPPGRHSFEFHYTGLSFTVPEKVRFKYRVEALDPDWRYPGTERSVNLGYIPPGNYTFRVLACNNDGIWSPEGASVEFHVLPHFWQTWWFRVAAAVLAAAAVAGVVLSVTRVRVKRKLERLERQRAIERERTRIAKDIHDDLGASLTRITMLSQSVRADLDHSGAATDVDRIFDTAREMTRAMDEIVWAVNPQHDTLDSLATYLGRFAQGFLASVHVRCRLDVPMQLPSWPLTAEVRHNLFLAFKEALNNAVKHSKTTEVQISMTIDPHGFTLCLEDKGCGFEAQQWSNGGVDPLRPGSGNGLANMRQRLAEIGGHCEIKSAVGNGTVVEFVVPVKMALA